MSAFREIVMDTETTGLDPRKGDRLVEIGGIELLDRVPTGKEFHVFINPDRVVPQEAIAIHGITNEFLVNRPRFSAVADDFLAFIGESQLVIHNASFDIGFINAELEREKKPLIKMTRVVDTLQLARRKHPAGPNSLDALCKRYNVDNSKRDKHGAIIDSLLLVEVYIELLGERQSSLGLASKEQAERKATRIAKGPTRARPTTLPPRITEADRDAHAKLVNGLGPNPLWKRLNSKTGS